MRRIRPCCPCPVHALLVLWALVAVSVAAQEPVAWPGQARADELAAEPLERRLEALRGLFTRLPAPGPEDWLSHWQESGQSVNDYVQQTLIRPGDPLTTIYVQPIGNLGPKRRQIVELTADFMERFFAVPVKLLAPLEAAIVPGEARRTGKQGQEQWLSTHILDKVLAPRRQRDALAVLALASADLWAGEGWNFVYGQASLVDRVGVWSIYRNGDPTVSDDAFKLCLRRTLKTAAHETAHMLNLRHCIAYNCLMNGVNHRAEADSRPLAFCPLCLAKLSWNVNADLATRCKRLADFCRTNGLDEEAVFYAKALEAVSK